MKLSDKDMIKFAVWQILSDWKRDQGYKDVSMYGCTNEDRTEYLTAVKCTTHGGEELHVRFNDIPIKSDSEGFLYIEAIDRKVSVSELREALAKRIISGGKFVD